MKASSQFESEIKAYLEARASSDELFAETFAKPNKSIAECCNYIIGEVHKQGKQAFADDEIYSMAVHYYDEDSIKAPNKIACKVVVSKSTAKAKPTKVAKQKRSKEPKSTRGFNQLELF